MNKSKRSILTAASSITLTLLNGVFALLITRLVILKYGSDFNGLNSTATQFISMLLIVEGGFTLATIVALFNPTTSNDKTAINRILSATRITFNKIGLIFLTVGLFASIGYSLIIRSDLSPFISFLVFFMTIVSTAFSLMYATKYKILLQSDNKEYIINGIQILTLIISQLLISLVVFLNGDMLLIRFSTMIGAILNSYLIAFNVKMKYKSLNFNEEPDFEAISGTNDIFIQKLTNVLYQTLPIIFISATAGTIYASVYIVYNNVFRLLKNGIFAFINAPRMGFGKLISEKELSYVAKIFHEFEFIMFTIFITLLSTTAVLIMPFIGIYTNGVNDVSYQNWIIAFFLVVTTFFEVIHIPSGNIINMAGLFKVGRKIQTNVSIVLSILMVLGFYFYDFYGILFAVMISSLLLACLEIYYVHNLFFKNRLKAFLRLFLPNTILLIILVIVELQLIPDIKSIKNFLIWGVILVSVNGLAVIIVNFIFNRKVLNTVFKRLARLSA